VRASRLEGKPIENTATATAARRRGAFRTVGLFWTCEDEVKEKGTSAYAIRAYKLSAYSSQLSARRKDVYQS
jgi:hypothetical protein